MPYVVTATSGHLGRLIVEALLGETNGELSRIIGRPTTPLAEVLAASV